MRMFSNGQQKLPSRLYAAVWQMRFFQRSAHTHTAQLLHGIINSFGSKLCVLAFSILTKESKLQQGKHKQNTHIALNVSEHASKKKKWDEERKTNAIAKRKMYGIEITIQWAKIHCDSDRSFMYHQQALHAPCVRFTFYVCLWLKSTQKEIENGELHFYPISSVLCVTLWHRLTVYSSLGKQTNNETVCEIVDDARSFKLRFQMHVPTFSHSLN